MDEEARKRAFENFTPRANPPVSSQMAVTSVKAVIDIADKDALKKLALGELVSIIQGNGGAAAGVGAIKELMDRIEGKAAQTVHQTNETTINVRLVERRDRARAELGDMMKQLQLEGEKLIIDHVDK